MQFTRFVFSLVFFLFFFRASGQSVIEADVCIYGGTSAGVIAAYAVQKLGKKAILMEPGYSLGGMSSGGLGYTDIGNKFAITGLARDFYRRVGDHYGKFEQWIFEPHVAEKIFNDYVQQGGYTVKFNSRVKEVKKTGTAITEVVFENALSLSGPVQIVRAKMFIDCTYEGDLMAKAGVRYRVGREANSEFNETINGVQLMKGHQFPDGVDPYVIKGQPESGLLWGISPESLAPEGSGDDKVQAYNFRICLSSNPSNRVTITRPEGYDSSRYELLLRLMDAQPENRTLNDYVILSPMPNQKTDINNRGGFSTDMIGMNYRYPEAGYEERAAIVKEHERYTKGLLYFLGNDLRVPQPIRDEMKKWGYPKDEYVSNGHWSPQLYVREARRMVGQYVMTQANCEGNAKVGDGVGLAAYTMDSHNTQRLVVNGQVKNEGNVEIGGFGPYPIAYRSLTPKPDEAANLLVPVCLSATHIAYGSIRMEPVFMVLAQSSATAAVMAIDQAVPVQEINVSALREKLRKDPLADGSVFEILVDNEDQPSVEETGKWERITKGGYGPSFLVNESGTSASVRFSPEIPKKGKYTVYLYFPKIPNAASATRIIVHDGKKEKTVTVRLADIRVEGQTSGEWVSLGNYDFPAGKKCSVTILSEGADGKTVADAVICVPAKSK